MNIFQKLARLIIKKSFNLSVWTIQQFHDMSEYEKKTVWLRSHPEGTIGADIVKCMDENHIKLVPGFESHDLKHVLLDYKMTPVDEIRMQAFMIGNRNYSPVSFAIFLFGAWMLPDKWSTFYQDFKKGRKAQTIRKWTIEEYANQNTLSLRSQIMESRTQKANPLTLKRLVMYGAICSVAAGISGMLFCLPFLFSSNIADLVGAGFPFVGGAILTVGGLLALSSLSRQSLIQEKSNNL
ncbi:hypothetical protein D3C87_14200 [compost metagenome]